jgi:hypothetical protein|tara:strand:- start:522 stop:671 length:150 start_codon:yes stop_codon:yes gene_type:complete
MLYAITASEKMRLGEVFLQRQIKIMGLIGKIWGQIRRIDEGSVWQRRMP